MTDTTRYYIWLSLGVGFCSPKPKRLMSMYKNIRDFYDNKDTELRLCGILSENEINKLASTDLKSADDIIVRCNFLGYKVIDISEPDYPEVLREIDNPPAVLYIQGTMPDFNTCDAVSVIGTRKATVYGVKTAFELGANLSKENFVIVSGGALGIDCAAHRGVLQSGGVTVCVLGCGIDYDYLRENKAMRNQIAVNGAVVSEYPPGTSASARNFPQRNRIISALSSGLIVVEAPKASGSMITVNLALEQNKDIFSVMGNIDSPYSEGTNALIKDGAIPVTSYNDVLEFYRGVNDVVCVNSDFDDDVINEIPTKLSKNAKNNNSQNVPVAVHKSSNDLSDDERKVYYMLGLEPMHVDKISEVSGIPVYKILRILSTLEMNDLIRNTDGRNYVIK